MYLEAFLSPADSARLAWDRVHPESAARRLGPRSSLQVLVDLARLRRDRPGRLA